MSNASEILAAFAEMRLGIHEAECALRLIDAQPNLGAREIRHLLLAALHAQRGTERVLRIPAENGMVLAGVQDGKATFALLGAWRDGRNALASTRTALELLPRETAPLMTFARVG